MTAKKNHNLTNNNKVNQTKTPDVKRRQALARLAHLKTIKKPTSEQKKEIENLTKHFNKILAKLLLKKWEGTINKAEKEERINIVKVIHDKKEYKEKEYVPMKPIVIVIIILLISAVCVYLKIKIIDLRINSLLMTLSAVVLTIMGSHNFFIQKYNKVCNAYLDLVTDNRAEIDEKNKMLKQNNSSDKENSAITEMNTKKEKIEKEKESLLKYKERIIHIYTNCSYDEAIQNFAHEVSEKGDNLDMFSPLRYWTDNAYKTRLKEHARELLAYLKGEITIEKPFRKETPEDAVKEKLKEYCLIENKRENNSGTATTNISQEDRMPKNHIKNAPDNDDPKR